MKRIFASIAILFAMTASAFADEGMWLLPLLQKMNYKDMKEAGLKLSAKEIYNPDGASLKDAIVQFGGGCTGEVISNNGLVITNHHCGYSTIQALSSTEHNYLEDGFWAMNRQEEIPAPGLTVTFLRSMDDVTGIVFKGLENGKSLKEVSDMLTSAAEIDNPHCKAVLQSFYNDNTYYLIVYKIYTDIRFVGAPPASMGKFGGETDNWMWPRHTCDFSMFRIYSDENGEPADYSPSNVPYSAKTALKISLAGVNEGDFSMIMGYPGRTQRFQTSAQLKNMVEVQNLAVEARTIRQDIMWNAMRSDEKVGLQYASKYASSANGWKKWQGMDLAFKNLGIIEKEQREEDLFKHWVASDANRTNLYDGVVDNINALSDQVQGSRMATRLIAETLLNIEILGISASFQRAYTMGMRAGLSEDEAISAACDEIEGIYKDYSLELDKIEAHALIDFYKSHVAEGNELSLGELPITASTDSLVEYLFSSALCTPELARETLKTRDDIVVDPAVAAYASIVYNYLNLLPGDEVEENIQYETTRYTAGLLEWKKGKPSYPDANFTMRLTYGNVKPYEPKDGVLYKHYTTLTGVMEKEDPNNYEFRVPEKLKEIYRDGDFGRYADKDGKLRTCFLTNNDITGGNSGSPVLNAKGELIGLAFDGNWESMSSDVMFEPDLQRCICVDIRYVLLMIDKFGGAGYLLDEMNISKK